MKKLILCLISIIFILVFSNPVFALKEFPTQYNVETDKLWKVKFNQKLNSATINLDTVFICKGNYNGEGKPEIVKGLFMCIEIDNQTIKFLPPFPNENYECWEKKKTYTIYITNKVENINCVRLSEPVKLIFTVK